MKKYCPANEDQVTYAESAKGLKPEVSLSEKKYARATGTIPAILGSTLGNRQRQMRAQSRVRQLEG